MIKKNTISEAIERPKRVRLNKGNSEGNRISRKIMLNIIMITTFSAEAW